MPRAAPYGLSGCTSSHSSGTSPIPTSTRKRVCPKDRPEAPGSPSPYTKTPTWDDPIDKAQWPPISSAYHEKRWAHRPRCRRKPSWSGQRLPDWESVPLKAHMVWDGLGISHGTRAQQIGDLVAGLQPSPVISYFTRCYW